MAKNLTAELYQWIWLEKEEQLAEVELVTSVIKKVTLLETALMLVLEVVKDLLKPVINAIKKVIFHVIVLMEDLIVELAEVVVVEVR